MYSNLSDMKFTGLRFFTVYGEGIREDLAISKFIKAMRANEPIYVYGDGTQSRDFTYVDDITEAIKLILESDKEWKNEVFDVGYGESTTVNELIGILKGLININYDKVVYQDEKAYDVKETLADTDKLYEWFGFRPRHDIKEGLSIFIKNNN
jgi:nucleoside-diphosphate-sugar epimerase